MFDADVHDPKLPGNFLLLGALCRDTLHSALLQGLGAEKRS